MALSIYICKVQRLVVDPPRKIIKSKTNEGHHTQNSNIRTREISNLQDPQLNEEINWTQSRSLQMLE